MTSRINWDEVPLGKVSDGVLSNRLGVTRQAVAKARAVRGIPSTSAGGAARARALTKMEQEDIVALEAAIAQLLDGDRRELTVAVATTVCRTPGWEVEARRPLRERARATGFRIRAPGRRLPTEVLTPERARAWLLEAGWVDAATAHIERMKAHAQQPSTGDADDAAA